MGCGPSTKNQEPEEVHTLKSDSQQQPTAFDSPILSSSTAAASSQPGAPSYYLRASRPIPPSAAAGDNIMPMPYCPEGTAEFWTACTKRYGDSVKFGENVYPLPKSAPYVDLIQQRPAKHEKFEFNNNIDNVIEFTGGEKCSEAPLGMVAHLHLPMSCYPVGAVWLYLTKGNYYYNAVKHKKRPLKDPTKVKLYFLYVEGVQEVGIRLKVDGQPVVINTAVSATDWECRVLPECFFTFSPEPGFAFATLTLEIPLRVKQGQPIPTDKRWARLNEELTKVIDSLCLGPHTLDFSIVFGYENTRLTAWSPDDPTLNKQQGGRTISYRYRDESRTPHEVSGEVAKGSVTITK